jgi:hypothetical protein
LTIIEFLHSTENRVEVGFHVPRVFACAARKPQALEDEEAVPELDPAPGAEIEPKELVSRCRPVSGDLPIKRREANLADLAVFRFKCILLGPEAELYCAFVFGPPPNAMLHVVSIQPEFLSIRYSPEGDVSVRVLGVRVDYRNPFEVAPDVCLHSRHHFADEFLEVNALPELWRNNKLEHPGVTGGLPIAQFRGYVGHGSVDVEADAALSALDVNSTVPDDVPTMRSPLASHAVPGIRDPHGATLPIGCLRTGLASTLPSRPRRARPL